MSSSDPLVNPAAFEGLPTRLTAPEAAPEELEPEIGLRPARLEEFVGQERVVENLRVALEAAKRRGETLDHVLFSGPPGLGKTSLARILAAEAGYGLTTTSGPALERPKDLVGLLTQLAEGDIFFIDEIHRVPASVEEYLYSAMEDYSIDFTLDQGPNARVLPLKLAHFTLVGATTREGLLSAPFRSRFGLLERLAPYPTHDLERIVQRAAGLFNIVLEPAAARTIAERSRGTPRVANRFLRRVRDHAQVAQGAAHVTVSGAMADEALERLGVDERGLEDLDRRILAVLAGSGAQPVGLKTIAAAVGESEDTIEEVFEPHLLRLGLLQKTARGRMITDAGRSVVGATLPERPPGA